MCYFHKSKTSSMIFVFLCLVLVCACAGEVNPNLGAENSATGVYHPRLLFPSNLPRLESATKSLVGIDCAAAGISTLEFSFTHEETSYGPFIFECEEHGALISDVPVGVGVRVDVQVYNQKEIPMLLGSEETDIVEGQVNDGGQIRLAYTSPYMGLPEGHEPDYTNDFGMGFVLIPSGEFTMGSPAEETGREYWEQPPHRVELTREFYLQSTEVTQSQWEAVTGEESPSFFKYCGPNCPVEMVSWEDVNEFIGMLNERDDGSCTYRLPTEAEWEYAARAGSATAFANGDISTTTHAFDPVLNSMGWYVANSDVRYEGCYDLRDWGGDGCSGTNPVAQKDPNDWDLYDMHGNVWEWSLDFYEEGADLPEPEDSDDMPEPEVDPTGPATGDTRVIRGGSWVNIVRSCRSASRNYNYPNERREYYGFRLVCSMPE